MFKPNDEIINVFESVARVGRFVKFEGQRTTKGMTLRFEPAENWEALQPAAVQAINDLGWRLVDEKNHFCPQYLVDRAIWPIRRRYQ